MNFKCPICLRTFSQRTAYSQHAQRCIKKIEVEEDDNVNTEDDQVSNYENDNIEVITLF